ncbi:MAG: hypothetical protein V3574_02210 [Candidatus Moraniibacteriota bacterium]
MEGQKLNPLDPNSWSKAQAGLQEELDNIFKSIDNSSGEVKEDNNENPQIESDAEDKINYNPSLRRPNRKKHTKPNGKEIVNTKKKILEASSVSAETKVVRAYLLDIIGGISFGNISKKGKGNRSITRLITEVSKSLDLRKDDIVGTDIESKKEEALRMLTEEVEKRFKASAENSGKYKIYNKIIEVLNLSKERQFGLKMKKDTSGEDENKENQKQEDRESTGVPVEEGSDSEKDGEENPVEEKAENKEEESEKSKSYVQESYDKLHSAGVSDEDLKYFFNLPRKERDEILNLNGNKLAEALKMQKLRNAREKQDTLNEELFKNFNLDDELAEKKKKERILTVLSRQLQEERDKYLKKEDEVGVKISRLKNFFRNFASFDKDYQIEKELEIYKENYERALKNYMEAIVELEGIEDDQEAEIMYRHAKFGETLNLMSAKEDLKFQKHPLWESMKRDLSVGTLDLVDKYSELLGRPKNWIMEKTSSKALGFGGGLVAVGGAMSFLASNLPGIRGLTVSMGIAVASKGSYKRAEAKNVIEKEKGLKSGSEELMRRVTDLQGKIDQELIKRELNISLENVPESARKEIRDYYKRLGSSFVKGLALGAGTYFGGQYLRESGLLGEGIEATKKFFGLAGISIDQGADSISGLKVGDLEVKSPEGSLVESDGVQTKNLIHGSDTHQGPTAPQANLNSEASGSSEIKTEISQTEKLESATGSKSDPVLTDNSVDSLTQIKVIEGKGIKDSLAQFLAQNHEKLTEGKMGWDPEKYASIEEWADKRAIGIVGEMQEKYPDYNFDKVSAETDFQVDLSDKADIRIVGLEDKFNLGGNPESIEELKFEESGASQTETIEEIQKEENLEKAEATENPIAETSESAGDNQREISSEEREDFREAVIAEMKEKNPDFNLEESLNNIKSELRGGAIEIGGEQAPSAEIKTVGAKMSLGEFYSEFAVKELPGLTREDSNLGKIFRGINLIGKESVANQPEKGVFALFRQTFDEKVVNLNYNEGDTVRKVFLRAIGRAYEEGKLEDFKEALRNTNIS